jgi:SNF2 family DNA or RNA helicase
MGAGKTRAAIETVKYLREETPEIAGSVFCTNSLKYQWREEIRKWDPGAKVAIIDGTKAQRAKQWQALGPAQYVILGYTALIYDWDHMQKHLPMDFAIADEATAIKSFKAKRSRRLKEVGRHVPVRLALTGQPVENRPEELFSIMEFVDPTVFGDFYKFDRTFITRDHFGRPERYKNLVTMHRRLDPAMVRWSREDIAQYLPEKNEIELPVRAYPKTQHLIDVIHDDLLGVLEDVEPGAEFNLAAHYGREEDTGHQRLKGEVMSRVTCLRLLCCHPTLLSDSAIRHDDPDTATGSRYASTLRSSGYLNFTEDSAKLDALMEYVDELVEEGPFKLVIFSGFKMMLRLIGAELRERKIGYTLMDGDTPSEERFKKMDRFKTSSTCQVFLSSDAGSYGIDLDVGTNLVNYDLPWSGGVLQQRIARIDRTSSLVGQIDIVNLFTADSIDEYQYLVLSEKAKVAGAFVDAKDIVAGKLDLDLNGLKNFLEERRV